MPPALSRPCSSIFGSVEPHFQRAPSEQPNTKTWPMTKKSYDGQKQSRPHNRSSCVSRRPEPPANRKQRGKDKNSFPRYQQANNCDRWLQCHKFVSGLHIYRRTSVSGVICSNGPSPFEPPHCKIGRPARAARPCCVDRSSVKRESPCRSRPGCRCCYGSLDTN